MNCFRNSEKFFMGLEIAFTIKKFWTFALPHVAPFSITNIRITMIIFLVNSSYIVFLTTSFFTTSLSLLKVTGTGTNSSISDYQTSFLKFVFLN